MTFNNDFSFNNYLAARVRRVAKKSYTDNVWETRNKIAAEIRPPADKLDDLNIEETVLTRMANRRKTDAKGNSKGNNASFFHPSVGLPEVGVRMISVQNKPEDSEEYVSPENTSSAAN